MNRVLSYLVLLTSGIAFAAEESSPKGASSGANLALVATTSTSFVSGHETITALNDGFTPANSDDKRHGAYGNWPRRGTQWVQYDWTQPISTRRMEVYWFDDRRGVRLPTACRLKSWNGSEFVTVTNATGLGVEENRYNTTTFPEITTTQLRLEFDDNRFNDALHNHVHTRARLKEYDPDAAQLCAEVFGEIPWRYVKPGRREAAGRAHLAGFDPAKAPRFQWREVPIPEWPRVRFETELGNIEVELDAKAAPITVSNFLRYAHQRLYNDGRLFRTVTLSNQPDDQVKIQVLQAEANPDTKSEFFPPIPLERTRDTGLRHLDGTLSMARDGPDTAQDSFSVCIGDQPELDFGGKRNADGQGFAAFGKVIRGMELVRKIHAMPADGQILNPPFRIQRAVRLN